MPAGRKTGGRQAGTPNKATGELRRVAQRYTKAALATLAAIMRDGESEAARVSAANALLDRGYGKPPQALTDSEGGALVPKVVEHIHVTVGPVDAPAGLLDAPR